MSRIIIHDTGLKIVPNVSSLPVCNSGEFRATMEFKVSYSGEVEIKYSIEKGKKAHFKENEVIKKVLKDIAVLSSDPKTIQKDVNLCLLAPIHEEKFCITVTVKEINVTGTRRNRPRKSRCSFTHMINIGGNHD